MSEHSQAVTKAAEMGRDGRFVDPASVRLLAIDVDGVLTDGSIMLDDDGRELKRFNVRDGLGLKMWMGLGFKVAVITRRKGGALAHRMRELGVDEVTQGAGHKGEVIEDVCRRMEIPCGQTCFVGDDLPDLAAMRRVGYPVAVADAEEAVRAAAAWVTTRRGGCGAVREVVDRLIAARGLMEQVVGQYH